MSMLIGDKNGELVEANRNAKVHVEQGTAGEPIDFLDMIRRHPRVLFLCVLVSTALAVLYYLETPPVYESFVDILIESKQAPVFTTESMMDRQIAKQKHIATHTYSLTSPLIVKRALEGTGPLASFSEADDPVAAVIDNLSIEVVEDESDVVSLKCRSGSQQECLEILTQIVASYRDFLGETSESIGKETADLIGDARDGLLDDIRELETEYRGFQQAAPIVWKDGKGVNTHHERQLQIENARSELAIERAKIKSQLDGALETLSRPNGRKVVFFEAMQELSELDRSNYYGGSPGQVVDRETARVLSEQLFALEGQEAQLTEEFGSGHPDLQAIRRRIRNLKSSLTNVDSSLSATSVADSPDKINEYVTVYVQMLDDKLTNINRQMSELGEILEREQELANAMQAFVSQDESLQKDLQRTQDLFDAVVARLDEINIVRDHGGDRMRVMAEPKLGEQVSPSLLKAVALASVLSILSGFGFAFLLDSTEASFRRPDEVREVLQRPIVGMIPQLASKGLSIHEGYESLDPILVTAHRTGSNASEAFRAVRTSLFFSTQGDRHKVIQVTSPLPSDGKSTLAANLAITVAQAGKRVLLIDADFRRPSLHSLFGRPKHSEYGFAEVVVGEADPADEDLVTEIDNLFVMTCGVRPTNPSELLTSPEFESTLEMLRGRYDFVILDSPPLLAVTDPAAIAARVDGVLMALRVRRGSRVSAIRANEVLKDVGANLLGVIVNAVDKKSTFSGYKNGKKYGYGYGYGYQYSSEEYREESTVPTKYLQLQSHDG